MVFTTNRSIVNFFLVLDGGAENIVRLRTSTPLFKAYEIAYSILDETYCLLFHQSDDFFPLLFDTGETVKSSKTSSRYAQYFITIPLSFCDRIFNFIYGSKSYSVDLMSFN